MWSINFDQLYQKYIDDGSTAKKNKSKYAGLYNLHESVLLTLSNNNQFNSKTFDSYDSIVQFINNRKRNPAKNKQCYGLLKCVKACAKRISRSSITSSTSSNANNTQAFSKQEDLVLFLTIFLYQHNGIVDGQDSKPFARGDIKSKWDILVYSQERSISFDALWKRFKDKSFIRKVNDSNRLYILNKPQLEKQAKQNLKNAALLRHLNITPTARFTNNSVHLGQHLICIYIRSKLQNMSFKFEDNVLKSVIESKGHNIQLILDHFLSENISESVEQKSASDNEIIILSNSGKQQSLSPEIVIISKSTRPFQQSDWQLLLEKYPELYEQRLEIRELAERQALSMKYKADLIISQNNGNCILQCNWYNVNGLDSVLTTSDIQVLLVDDRLDLMQFMGNNSQIFDFDTETFITDKFAKDKQLLEDPHVIALSHMHQRNTVVMIYNEKCHDFDKHIYSNKEWKNECLHMAYSCTPTGHNNYIAMGLDEQGKHLFSVPDSCESYTYIPAKKGQMFGLLQQFDLKNEIEKKLSTSDLTVKMVFGPYTNEMIEFYSESVLNNLVVSKRLTAKDFANKNSEQIGQHIATLLYS